MRYRGTHLWPTSTIDDANRLSNLNVNVVRYMMAIDAAVSANWGEAEWAAFVTTSAQNLKNWVAQSPINFIIDLHIPWIHARVSHWIMMAEMFKGVDNILGFAILNEPNATPTEVKAFMSEATQAIKIVDPDRRVIVTTRWCAPKGFKNLIPLGYPKKDVWYEVHCYAPLNLTHQGVPPTPYPKPYPTAKLNKEYLKKFLKPVRNFQKKYNKRIFLGEFGISSFAPLESRIAYIKDVISIANAWSWVWTVFSFPDSPYWNHENKPELAQVLYDEWAKNG